MYKTIFPFSAIVGQEQLKFALILNAINPHIGGVIIRGEKGTAKSTAVRALTALLPKIRVVDGCPCSCDPDELSSMCGHCKKLFFKNRGSRHLWQAHIKEAPARVVTLPLNATEDMVAGGIDFDLAIKKGMRALQPGILAKANRGILYVDEVNLLDDHIVDIILDSAASGKNRVEREGISFSHPAFFILVGTMNPEEGELRPQFLDRFGLCVEVGAETDPGKRVLLMQRREEYDAGPVNFIKRFERQNLKIAEDIIHAREGLRGVRLSSRLRILISELCLRDNVAGHRADLVIEQAARAVCALEGRLDVTVADIKRVAAFALAHRKRDPVPSPPPPVPEEQETEEQNESRESQSQEGPGEQQQKSAGEQDRPLEGDKSNQDEQPENRAPANEPPEQVFDVGATFKVKKFQTPRDKVFRRGSGRRSRSRISQKQGRYIKSTSVRQMGDIALDATLRAAAPYQLGRKGKGGLAVYLKKEDIREKIREKRIGNFLLFLVDASGSMGARGRMVASKGAVMSLLLDAYQKRDRVGMVSFKKNEALVNLPPTSSVELAGKLLGEMPVGGRTPLSAGLLKAFELLRNELIKEPTSRPIVFIITDGKANAAIGEKNPIDEALDFASKMALEKRIRYVVVDTEERGLIFFGLAMKLAGAMGAQYFKIDDLESDQLINIVKGRT